MERTLSRGAALAALLVGFGPWSTAAPIQVEDPARDPAEVQAEGLTDLRSEFEALNSELEGTLARWERESKAKAEEAKKNGTRPVPVKFPDLEPFHRRALGIVDGADVDLAVEILIWTVERETALDDEAVRVLERLSSEKYVGSAAMEQIPALFGYLPNVAPDQRWIDRFLRDVAEGTTIPKLKAQATYTRLKPVLRKAERGSKEYSEHKAELQAAVLGCKDRDLISEIEQFLRINEHYAVGCTPPDMLGPDLNGVVFKLSDYRGKVIFLDFWADW